MPGAGRSPPDLGRVRPAGQRHRRHPARSWRHRAGQGGAVPLQRPRVHRVDVRGVQGRAGADQHQLPVHGRRARLPVGQRRLRGGRLPRRVHRHDRAHPRPGPRRRHLAVGRRRPRRVPRVGDPLRAGRQQPRRRRARRARVGPQRRPAAHDLHGRHHRHAQGRDVAAGRPVPHAGHPDEPGVQGGRGRRPRRRARGGAGPGHRRHAGVPAHARHGPLHAAHHAVAGRQHRAARRPQAQHRGAARHHRGREGQLDRHRGRRLRAPDRSRRSTRTPAGGTCRRCS